MMSVIASTCSACSRSPRTRHVRVLRDPPQRPVVLPLLPGKRVRANLDFDVVCFRSNGSLMEYDSDGDMVPTRCSRSTSRCGQDLVAGLAGPRRYLDTNGNGMVDTGDTLIAFEQ